ncbi:MAG: riboflavin kinase / adenylyltransferase [Thermoleophilaceae bacterium]|nr:riboflavin kinase / adenylyltransferase [Thermoleophilaceae bacterium]
MKVTQLPDLQPTGRRRKVAIGTFDGVHLGHREVIGGADTVLTFDPHPLEVLRPDKLPRLLTPFPIKRDLIAGLGADELVVIPFDHEFSQKPAEEFIQEVLIDKLGAEQVSVGENFHFGKDQGGNPELLRSHDEFETRVAPLVEVDGKPVSSTRIRKLVESGDVGAAGRLLGSPFLFEGEVVEGDKRGRELGMPTANLVPDPKLVTPANGVYAAWAHGHPAAVNVGVRPTFDSDRGVLVEAYLLDFSGDLYGQTLRVAFIERLRGEKRFDSAGDLVAQMHRDVEQAREIASATVPRR